MRAYLPLLAALLWAWPLAQAQELPGVEAAALQAVGGPEEARELQLPAGRVYLQKEL